MLTSSPACRVMPCHACLGSREQYVAKTVLEKEYENKVKMKKEQEPAQSSAAMMDLDSPQH